VIDIRCFSHERRLIQPVATENPGGGNMIRSGVTVVPIYEGRFMIVPSDLSDTMRQEMDNDDVVDGHTEAGVREVLKTRYGMSSKTIDEHVAVAKALAEEPGPELVP
jgi:hypothetical protein